MLGYNVHEFLYRNCEIHGPMVRGSGFNLDQGYGHMVKNVLYIKEIFSTFTAGEDKLNAWL